MALRGIIIKAIAAALQNNSLTYSTDTNEPVTVERGCVARACAEFTRCVDTSIGGATVSLELPTITVSNPVPVLKNLKLLIGNTVFGGPFPLQEITPTQLAWIVNATVSRGRTKRINLFYLPDIDALWINPQQGVQILPNPVGCCQSSSPNL